MEPQDPPNPPDPSKAIEVLEKGKVDGSEKVKLQDVEGLEALQKCMQTFTKVDCSQPPGSTAFTITDEVLQKLLGDEIPTGGDSGKKPRGGAFVVIEKQDQDWRSMHDCVDVAHARKTGTDTDSINNLEKRLKEYADMKCPCANGNPVLMCYDANIKSPLQCMNLVRDYMKCLNNYRQNIMDKMANGE